MACLTLLAPWMAAAQSPVGTWKTIDDKTGDAKSHLEIYEKGGKLYGKVVKLLKKGPDTRCDKCSGAKKDQLVVGMNVVEGMAAEDGMWKGGKILDPENGNEYACSMWFEKGQPDELRVRGKHWTGLYRTQTWYRVK
ncbi:MAG: DUF2147 domain-containing protein [Saprospiraceae bacterium]|nr:DUF2147 domain-containing protein [Saprospiraceae bacterium]